MKFNDITLQDVFETKKEKRWFSVIKNKAEKLQYGSMNVIFIIKKGEVVNIKIKEKDKTYNIGG